MHRSLLKRFPLFIWLLFAVSSVSNFRPGTGGLRWSLVQVHRFSSVLLRGGRRRCRQTSLCVGSTRRVLATLGLPRSRMCAFPSTLLRLPAALYGAGPAWHAVPVFGYPTKAWTRLDLHFVPSPPEQLRPPGACRARSPGCGAPSPLRGPSLFPPVGCLRLVSVLGSWPLAATLPADVDHPQSQKSLVRDWKPVCSLVGEAVSGAEFAPFPSPLPPASGQSSTG